MNITSYRRQSNFLLHFLSTVKLFFRYCELSSCVVQLQRVLAYALRCACVDDELDIDIIITCITQITFEVINHIMVVENSDVSMCSQSVDLQIWAVTQQPQFSR